MAADRPPTPPEDVLDQAYTQGSRRAWLTMLAQCVRELGYDTSGGASARWIIEREETALALRDVCGHFGDNDWPDNLHLADVVQKHLGKHLHAEAL